jgi:hypothetical protein
MQDCPLPALLAQKLRARAHELRNALGVKPVQRTKACVKELISL